MKINKSGKEPIVTREVYKAVKKYDRGQFDTFCTTLYQNGHNDGYNKGYEAGCASVANIKADKLLEVIAATKGIGPVKLAEIKANIEAAFGGNGNA